MKILLINPFQGDRKMKCVAAAIVVFSMALFTQAAWAADATAKDAAKSEAPAKADTPANTPADRVVVMYFHRTQRCPTCLRMGGYTEEAVLKGFVPQIKDGTVEFHYVDFQDEKNAALTKAYKVSGPTLIVAQVIGNKVKEFKNLKDIWAKNNDKDAFLKYVRDSVIAYQKKTDSKAAMTPDADGTASKAN
jgi:hypothetical protein